MKAVSPALARLARHAGIEPTYRDVFGKRHAASPQGIVATLRQLGHTIRTAADAPRALKGYETSLWQQPCDPVTVMWQGTAGVVLLRVPHTVARSAVRVSISSAEDRTSRTQTIALAACRTVAVARIDGTRMICKRIPLPQSLRVGYYTLELAWLDVITQVTLMVAPKQMYAPPHHQQRTDWGLFAPLYALHSVGSWGIGDWSDLQRTMRWVGRRGGSTVSTLPMLAATLDRPYEPSPYSPLTRRCWNEVFLDITKIAELKHCRTAQRLMEGRAWNHAFTTIQQSPLVRYRDVMRMKRRMLEPLAADFFTRQPSGRWGGFQRFLRNHPHVDAYARFRAVLDRQRTAWTHWPARIREGQIQARDYSSRAYRTHLYAQWQSHAQMQSLKRTADRTGVGLYLDFPLGVHTNSFDVWYDRELFAREVHIGAPPDTTFTQGQDWGLPPLHPERDRAQGYAHLRACLRHQMCMARWLRIDHIMGLHRLYWIPKGAPRSQGVYVRYHADELYAVLAIESHRHRTAVVGENLGTVSPEVHRAMARRRMHGMSVLQYELPTRKRQRMKPVAAQTVASINTHDMYPFAACWQGKDIIDHHALHFLSKDGLRRQRKTRDIMREALLAAVRKHGRWRGREPSIAEVLAASLCYLGQSRAELVLLNLEDCWLETQPQNVPSTWRERPNWQRKLRYTLAACERRPEVRQLMHVLHDARRQTRRRR